MDVVNRVDWVIAWQQTDTSTTSPLSTTKSGNPADSQQTVITRFTL